MYAGGLFLGCVFYSIACLYASATHFDYCSFVISFKIRMGETSNFVIFQDFFLAFGSYLRFQMNFRMDFSISAENTIGILIGSALNL